MINGLSPGTIIGGKYAILKEIGRGGMGVVYKAEDTQLKRTAALKFLSPDLALNEAHRKLFTQEARTASALNHPNIGTIYEVGEAGGNPYIAMEFVEGQSLDGLIPAAGMPAGEVLRVGRQIIEGLQHAHEHGIIHRDLKPANIVISAEGRIKILDFGLAKRIEKDKLRQITLSQRSMTEDGLFAGTLPYLAPERLHGRSALAGSDIWALGVILYQMVSGRLPFDGRTGFSMTSAILRDAPAPLPAGTPAGLRAIVQKCLEKDLGRRFRTAAEVRAALETAARVQDVPTRSSGSQTRTSKARWFIAAADLILAGIAILMIAKGGRPGRGVLKSPPVGSTGARASSNSGANEYFEKGMLFLRTQFDLPQARAMLEKALEFDPAFAEARAWYGFTFVLEIDSGLSNDSNKLYRAGQELQRALRDDPNSARAHSSLAALYLYQGRKDLLFEEAQKGRALDPNEMDSNNWLANYYLLNGDYAAAKNLLLPILARDPLLFALRMNLGDILRLEGDWAGAIRENKKILEQDPRNIYAPQKLARIYIEMNDLAQARRSLEQISPGGQSSYEVELTWVLLLALEGKAAEAGKIMDEDCQKYGALSVFSTSVVAEYYAVVGEPEKALDWLERAVRNGDERAEWFRRDPLLAKIRNLPRFSQILESIDFRRKRAVPSTK